MAISDPVSDMLTRIRNAAKAKYKSVDIPGSVLKTSLAQTLKDEGFVNDYKFVEDNKQGVLRVYLKYDQDNVSAIRGLKRVSKPSRRVYSKSREITPVLNGLGVAILSTSRGILTDKAARNENLGGEVLCNVW
jgi:small subunit ribosomal protein S8